MTKVDNETPADLCALLGCGLSTALGTINYEADLKIGESTLILGCGGLGLNLIQASKIAGSYPVCVFDINDKSSLAASLGADNFHININDILNNKYDCIVDTTGNAELIKQVLPLLGDRGRFVLLGQNKPGLSLEILNSNHLFGSEGKTIKATQGGDIIPSRDIPRYAKLHKSKYLNIDKIKIIHINSFTNSSNNFVYAEKYKTEPGGKKIGIPYMLKNPMMPLPDESSLLNIDTGCYTD